MNTVQELDRILTTPSKRLLKDLADLEGNIVILGAGGKMGPSLAMLIKRVYEETESKYQVYGVSRFSDEKVRHQLENAGIKTVSADLIDEQELQSLPEAPYVIYVVGNKFGRIGKEHFTWALNSYLPGRIAKR